MPAESRKNGIHNVFATQTIRQMRKSGDDNDAIAFGNASRIFGFRMSASDADHVSANFGDDESARELVMLPNYAFKALAMNDGTPVASDPVMLTARKAMAWASENTRPPTVEIERQIMEALK
jgi:hypothetical protein